MPAKNFDVIVLGVGTMGSVACYFLAQRGHKVLGLEQFTIPHDKGSHGGQSRIIRKAYFEHPDYVPLLNRAYENWAALEQQTDEKLYYNTGLLYAGPHDHPIITGVKKAASLFSIPVDELSSTAAVEKFPAIKKTVDNSMLFEPGAGFLLPAKAISLYAGQAIKFGATINTNEKTLGWKKENGQIKVITDKAVYYASKLILTPGAWAPEMITGLPLPVKITRQVLIWVKPDQPKQFMPEVFPCWMIATKQSAGVYYGFPFLSENEFGYPGGLKFALHYPGAATDANQVNREVGAEEIASVVNELREYFPAAASRVVATQTCLYSNSPDEDFIIDHLTGYDDAVTIACGFSGHGFKFASVIGEILADLAIKGNTELPVEFLRLNRFSS